MTNPHDRELAVFSAARQLPPRERAAYLDEACAGDPALRQRIEELLQASASARDFLNNPALVPLGRGGAVLVQANPAEKPGDRIGRFKLIQQIGEGGCGVVYLAEQEAPVRRRVALKILKLGMDTRNVIARLEAERQTLALMDHPHIAKVLDAGATESGRPYFVMELVEGLRITEFCDQQQLSTRGRLELFVLVCQAVQHAHQKGVIHRDLKPSNILVTLRDGVPTPMVIDFGIAKATEQKLTEKTVFTAFEQILGTPAYMSPEQAEMSERGIDTRSDIYSLGVLLYELLTGHTPFDTREVMQGGIDALRRVIRETEPVRPSNRLGNLSAEELTQVAVRRQAEPPRLIHAVRGDVDWIVMKALEKERNRRYATANGLAVDLKRHLANEPVVARPPSELYRIGKLIRRNQLVTFASVAGLLALVAGLVTTSYFYFQEREVSFHSLLAEAQARRTSGRMGQRFESLRAVEKAAAIHRTLEVRNAGIAAFAVDDIRVVKLARQKWPTEPSRAISFDGEFKRYAQPDTNGNIGIYSPDDDRLLFTLPTHGRRILETFFSPAGHYLQAAERINDRDSTARLWDLERRQVVLSGYDDYVRFTGDDRFMLRQETNFDLTISETVSGLERTRYSPGEPLGFYTPDATGTRVAGVPPHGLTLVIYGTKTNQEALRIQLPFEAASPPAWSPDGETVAVGCHDRNVYLLDSTSGQLRGTLHGHWGSVTSVTFNHSGSLLKSGGWDDTVRFWQPFSATQIFSFQAADRMRYEFSPDDRFVSVVLNNQFGLVEVKESRECRIVMPTATAFDNSLPQFDAAGQIACQAASARVWFWEVASGKKLASFPFQTNIVDTAMFDRSNHWFITTERKGLVKIRSVKAAQNVFSLGPERVLAQVADPRWADLSRDGRHLAVPSHEPGEVVVLDLLDPSSRIVLKNHPLVDYVAISPDAHWVASGSWANRFVTIWDVRTRQIVKTLKMLHRARVVFSPDGRTLVTMCMNYQFWEVGTWKLQRSLPSDAVVPQGSFLAFGPDGRIMAVIRNGDQIELLDSASGTELARLEPPEHVPLGYLAFSPDGTHLVGGASSQQIALWDLRLIREELATMKLDWDQPPYPAAAKEVVKPVTMEIAPAAESPAAPDK
jgi:serine/threonine protein kinase/WD40 repeat protein